MPRIGKTLAACLVALLVGIAASAQRNRTSGSGEQSTFAMETPIKRPYRVPKYVIEQIVRNDDLVEPANREEAVASLAERVRGSLINLDNDGKPDFLVQGDDGANITGFWIFRNVGQRWRLVLATRALGISLDKTYTNGLHDISVEAASAVVLYGTTYKFDLERYVPRECWERNLTGRNKKIRYFKCSEDSVKPYR